MGIPSKIKMPIENEMKLFESFFAQQLGSKSRLLNIITNHVLRSKGKQMRPTLVFLSAKLNGKTSEATYVAASMIELLHTATLVHDDVVDETYQRRGVFSINTLWGSKMAVLAGDYFLSTGLMIALKSNQPDILEIVSTAVREMSEGELTQLEKSRRLNITEDIYLEIIRKKTATFIAACTKSGAYSAGADNEHIDRMHRFGEYLGMAFQIRDDLLDYEETNLAGKPTGNDLKEKKITLPLIYLLNNSTSVEKNMILRTIQRYHNEEKKIIPIVKEVKRSGGIEYARSKMFEYQNRAFEMLKTYPESETLEAMRELVYFVTERNS
ncbi:MAG: polyprenyl synthetase family protein [Cytophagaceae bacterium]|jgi:octaprenyl-diphosphate synthase|nr:polyprenyl synthetase family protein [Cytophagaceae bacterium]